MQLFAVRPGETVRSVAALPASVVLQDVRPDGSVLLETQSRKVRMLVKVPGEEEERDIGWFESAPAGHVRGRQVHPVR